MHEKLVKIRESNVLRVVVNDTLVVPVSSIQLSYVEIAEQLEIPPETVAKLSFHSVMSTRRSFNISDKINSEILRIVESGFMEKWLKDAKRYAKTYTAKSKDTLSRLVPLESSL